MVYILDLALSILLDLCFLGYSLFFGSLCIVCGFYRCFSCILFVEYMAPSMPREYVHGCHGLVMFLICL